MSDSSCCLHPEVWAGNDSHQWRWRWIQTWEGEDDRAGYQVHRAQNLLDELAKHTQFCVKKLMIQRCSYLVKHAKVQLGQQEIVTNMLDNIPQFCVKKLREEERWKIFYSLIKKKCIYNRTCISPQLQEKVEVLLSIPRKGIIVHQYSWHKTWVISIAPWATDKVDLNS